MKENERDIANKIKNGEKLQVSLLSVMPVQHYKNLIGN